jgi:hypothetical protein
MQIARRLRGVLGTLFTIAVAGGTLLGCSDDSFKGGTGELAVDTTRLCAIVPARDPAKGQFPLTPPVKVFGTDLGWTYEANGRIPILFGDTWQRIDICPVQLTDDSIGTLHLPESNWPGFTASSSIPDEQCPDVTYELDDAGTSFAPITLHRWDGVLVPLGPNSTPVTGFFDGQKEWAIFIVGGGQVCTPGAAASGAVCPTDLSPQAADLVCGTAFGQPRCIDPTSTREGDARLAYYLHIAERVSATEYVSRAMFLTNKYLNVTARTVRAFAEGGGASDYEPGQAALLMWGRPGFENLNDDGDSPPYFMYHPLPFQVAGDRIVFAPRFLRGLPGGEPEYSDRQLDAVPLYTEELAPVNHVALSWLSSLDRWLMIYSGSDVDFADPLRQTGRGQPVKGAMYARIAPEPWGPWSDPTPVLTPEQTAQDLVCGHQAPAGCLPYPDPLIRPDCLEAADPRGGGALYGANIIDAMTRSSGSGVDVFWLYSTWHPYGVVLARTRVQID